MFDCAQSPAAAVVTVSDEERSGQFGIGRLLPDEEELGFPASYWSGVNSEFDKLRTDVFCPEQRHNPAFSAASRLVPYLVQHDRAHDSYSDLVESAPSPSGSHPAGQIEVVSPVIHSWQTARFSQLIDRVYKRFTESQRQPQKQFDEYLASAILGEEFACTAVKALSESFYSSFLVSRTCTRFVDELVNQHLRIFTDSISVDLERLLTENAGASNHRKLAMRLAEATAEGRVDAEGSALYCYLTEVRKSQDYDGCNELLRKVDVSNVDPDLLLALLVGTAKMPREKLTARSALYDKVFEKFVEVKGQRTATRVLGSLR